MNHDTHPRRAPWWAYAAPFAVANLLRQLLVPPEEVGDGVSIALFAATALTVFVVVTAAYAAARR